VCNDERALYKRMSFGLTLVHFDVCDPSQIHMKGGSKYYVSYSSIKNQVIVFKWLMSSIKGRLAWKNSSSILE